MKSVAVERRSGNILGVKKDATSRIMRGAHSAGIDINEEKFALSEEMKECFLQLSTMVPEVPKNAAGNIDGAALMSHVIDYILELEGQLGGGQAAVMLQSLQSQSQTLQSQSLHSQSLRHCREPLSEKSIDNIRAVLPPGHRQPLVLRATSQLSDADIRPPSK